MNITEADAVRIIDSIESTTLSDVRNHPIDADYWLGRGTGALHGIVLIAIAADPALALENHRVIAAADAAAARLRDEVANIHRAGRRPPLSRASAGAGVLR